MPVHRVLLPLGIGYARTSVFKSKDAGVLQGKPGGDYVRARAEIKP